MTKKIFVGWDGREKVAFDVLNFSINKHGKGDFRVVPLYHKALRRQGWFKRPWLTNPTDGNYTDLIDGKPFSTEFSHTRFLIPALMRHKGWALFMDCDMVMLCDVQEIFELCDDRYAVMCVKHRQKVSQREKMDGSIQTSYFRKNWSSFMLINCGHRLNRDLTADVVNTANGGWLHSFGWLDEQYIGALPDYYNWIEGSSPIIDHPRVIHYTEGGPWFHGYKDILFADKWWALYEDMNKDLFEPSDAVLNVDYNNI